MTINELIPIIILLFAAFICIYTITTRICECFEYEAKMNAEKTPVENKTSPEDEERFHKLLNTIFTICELAGFHIEGRIAIKDCKTGKIWR